MKEKEAKVLSVRKLNPLVCEIVLAVCHGVTQAGQFVEISVPEHFLRRPISVADFTDDTLTLLVKQIGEGTEYLCNLKEGATLNLLTPLGNGFCDLCGDVVLVGGGIGIAPLYGLLKRTKVKAVILGFRNKDDAFYVDEFKSLSKNVFVTTEDGSLGEKGFVTDILKTMENANICACGPMPMMRAIAKLSNIRTGLFSLEARMGCGFGACVGCTIRTKQGPARVCKEGPIFKMEDLVW